MSVSETHNLTNLRMTRASRSPSCRGGALAQQAGVPVNVSLSCVFGCPMEGDVPAAEVLGWARASSISGRTASRCATPPAWPTRPRCVRSSGLSPRWPATELTLHFHNTRGMGCANVLAAVDAGAPRFDTSLGGLGGCPYAPGATGNVCTEEIVHMLELWATTPASILRA